MKRRWKIVIGIVAGLVAMLVMVWLSPVGQFVLTGGLNLEEQPLDTQQWIAARQEEPAKKRIRLLMLEDVMENQVKTGMDSADVKALLGEPERDHGFSYGLGILSPGMEAMHLIVIFDDYGKVKKLDVESEGKFKK
jgi:hypothetical protein